MPHLSPSASAASGLSLLSSLRCSSFAGAVLRALPLLLCTALAALPLRAAEGEEAAPVPAWSAMAKKERDEVSAFAEDYKAFMRTALTETSFVSSAVRLAEAAGFSRLADDSPITPGARYYDVNRDRTRRIRPLYTP